MLARRSRKPIFFDQIMAKLTALIMFLLGYMTIGDTITTKKTTSPLTTKTPTATTKIPPTLQFSCISGKISGIYGVGLVKSAIVIDNRDGTMCHYTDNDCELKSKQTQLYVMYDESNTDTKVVAGHHPFYYELECKPGYVSNASAQAMNIGGTKPSYIHKDGHPSNEPGITITILKELKELNGASVSVGEKLTLQIKSPANSKIFPISCAGKHGNTYHPLWDNATCLSKDGAIMDDTWTTTPESISINMYAFRFVESTEVTIECSVYVCPLSAKACISSVKSCPRPSRRRRRSSFESNQFDKNKRQTSSVSYTVIDRYGSTNSSEGVSGNYSLYLTAIMLTMCVLGRK